MLSWARRERRAEARELVELLRKLRERKGLSQKDIMERLELGSTVSTLTNWETFRSSPILDNFVRWADVLGFRVVLMERSEGDLLDLSVWSAEKKLEELI